MKKSLGSLITTILYCVIPLFPSTVQAVVVTGLYEAEIPVLDQSASRRNKNMAAVLRVVLVKVTGDSQVPSHSSVAELLLNADQYVQQFEYRMQEEADKQQLFLWAQFNKSSLDKILRDAAIPEWGRERPSTLVWLVIDDTNGRRLSGLDDILGYAERMELRSKTRGIVLVHPLLDLEDTGKLNASDIWGGFQEPVRVASERYQADTVLTGRLESISSELWEANWIAYVDDQALTWSTQDVIPENVLDEGIDHFADVLAERYGQAGSYIQSSEIEIVVNNITDYNQYSKVLNYLESLNSVINVDVKEVNLGSVNYLLTTQADIFVISKAVGLGQTLEQISDTSYRLLQ